MKRPVVALSALLVLLVGCTSPARNHQDAQPATTLTPGTAKLDAAVPWSEIGPDWLLADTVKYEGAKTERGRHELLLISPEGEKFAVYPAPGARPAKQWTLKDWSPDGRFVLLDIPQRRSAVVLDLLEGLATQVHLANFASYVALDPTAPQDATPAERIWVYRPDGWVRPDGTPIAALTGLSSALLVTPDGTAALEGFVRRGRVTSTRFADGKTTRYDTGRYQCRPLKWWQPDTVLLGCYQKSRKRIRQQLQLLDLDAQRSRPLAPPSEWSSVAGDHSGWIDTDATGLEGKTYVSREAACGSKLAVLNGRGGSDLVQVPGVAETTGIAVLGNSRGRLLLNFYDSCDAPPPGEIVRFDPATGDSATLVRLGQGVMFDRIFGFGERRPPA